MKRLVSVIFKFKLLLEKHALMVSYLTIPPSSKPISLSKKTTMYLRGAVPATIRNETYLTLG